MPNSKNSEAFHVRLDSGGTVTALLYESQRQAPPAAVILAHGAGAGQLSPFMVATASAIAADGFDAVTFNFPYTEQGRKLPDRATVLESCYAAVIRETLRRLPSARTHLFIGGKSMGGRMATQLAAYSPDLPLAGIVLFGYPLHPPGKPEKRRDGHLPSVRVPMLVIQGSRDAFGTASEIGAVFDAFPSPSRVHIVEGGDHSFKVAGAGTAGYAAILDRVRTTAAEWMLDITGGRAATPLPPA